MNTLFVLITLTINFLLVTYYEVEGNSIEIASDLGSTLILILGFIHLGLAGLKLLTYTLT